MVITSYRSSEHSFSATWWWPVSQRDSVGAMLSMSHCEPRLQQRHIHVHLHYHHRQAHFWFDPLAPRELLTSSAVAWATELSIRRRGIVRVPLWPRWCTECPRGVAALSRAYRHGISLLHFDLISHPPYHHYHCHCHCCWQAYLGPKWSWGSRHPEHTQKLSNEVLSSWHSNCTTCPEPDTCFSPRVL